jgi:hypothetical protein
VTVGKSHAGDLHTLQLEFYGFSLSLLKKLAVKISTRQNANTAAKRGSAPFNPSQIVQGRRKSKG